MVPSLGPRANLPPIVAVVGPTATGKSSLAIDLAQRFGGQIVSADSRQVYRHMDIGTAKPSRSDRQAVLHHLYDLMEPHQRFDLASFLKLATGAIADIHDRGQLPILVGGSGQYVWALIEGWRLPATPPNDRLRAELETEKVETLHNRLAVLDPEAASRIHPNNVRRLVRALEARQRDGHSSTVIAPTKVQKYQPLILGLTMERTELYQRIDRRVGEMMDAGLLDEVRGLLKAGYAPTLSSMQSTGYKELIQHLHGEIDLEEAVQRIKFATHRLARRQYAWFRLEDPRIHWLDASSDRFEHAAPLVHAFLESKAACDTMPT